MIAWRIVVNCIGIRNLSKHILAIDSPYTTEELVLTIEALKNRIYDYEHWCLANEGKGLNLFPVGYFDALKRGLAILESMLESHAEHYGDYDEPADKN